MLPIRSIRPYVPTEPQPSYFPALETKPLRVVHAIGELTDSVARFLFPAATSLHRAAVRQYVLVLKGDGQREALERRLPPGTSITVIPDGAGLVRRSHEWLAALKHIRALGTLDVVHVHGATALGLLAGSGGVHSARRLVYSPHGAWDLRPSAQWRARASALLMLPIRKLPHGWVMSCHDKSVMAADRKAPERLAVVCPPLPQAFQLTRPLPPTPPIVLAASAGKSKPAATAVAQLGVLAAHGTTDAPVFQWSGPCDAPAARILTAAGVRIHRDEDPRARAARLSRAVAFVSPCADDGYPWHIAEAMACGVPVVALDTRRNRQLVDDGVTGFLCRTVEDMLTPVFTLIKRPEVRRSLGDAARHRVMSEFGRESFARRLLEAYGLPLAEPSDDVAVQPAVHAATQA
jgi:glycosyltransferase involved in cell wall biosynthesis